MAITLLKEPNQYNLAYVPNVYTLTGLNQEDKYAIAIEIDGTVVATFQQPSNLNGVAHFDVQKVLQSYLEPAFVETTQLASETPKEALDYRIFYGSTTDGVPTYDGSSDFKTVINGYDNWRVLNWNDTPYNPSASLLACEGTGNTARWNSASFLTNYPKTQYPLRSSSYHTLSFFNRMKNWGDGTLWPGTTEQPAYAVIKYYTNSGLLIQTSVFSLDATNGLGPRPDYNSTSLGAYTNDNLVGTVGVGPQNLKDANLWPAGTISQNWSQVTQTFGSNSTIWSLAGQTSSQVSYYTVELYSVDWCYWEANGIPQNNDATTLLNYLGSLVYSYEFKVEDPCTNFNVVTVSFLNQYGVKDYWTFDRRNTRTQSINRNNYNQSLGSWTEYEFEIDPQGRGRRTFSTDLVEEMTMSTNWMTDEESAWLEELFISPRVEIFVNGQWEPAVIASNVYEQKSYARDKMFQHTLTVTFANDKKVQRG